MPNRKIDLQSWSRRDQFALFRSFEKPHYAITTRLDVTRLMTECTPRGISVYRACLFAVGAGLDGTPALKQSFDGTTVTQHDALSLSMTVPRADGSFGLGYVDFDPDFARFDTHARERIAAAAASDRFEPSVQVDGAIAYVSCLPWIDFTAIDNALPHADDCIPRVAWGKIVPDGGGFRMAVSIQAHHALVDGAHMGAFFERMQQALDDL